MEQKPLTDSEKLDILSKRMRRMEINSHIQTAIVVLGFLGVLSLASLVDKVKSKVIK